VTVLGDGYQREFLEQTVRDYGLEDVVELPGHVDNPYAILRQADLFALPSRDESFSLAVAEAIVPVFDILEELIRTGNPNAVTDALVGTMMARSGILGALFNVKVNLASIQDADFVQALEGKIRALENQALEGERRVFALSSFSDHVL
jgi:formiminotetrahydrofolate cyclodeaminase